MPRPTPESPSRALSLPDAHRLSLPCPMLKPQTAHRSRLDPPGPRSKGTTGRWLFTSRGDWLCGVMRVAVWRRPVPSVRKLKSSSYSCSLASVGCRRSLINNSDSGDGDSSGAMEHAATHSRCVAGRIRIWTGTGPRHHGARPGHVVSEDLNWQPTVLAWRSTHRASGQTDGLLPFLRLLLVGVNAKMESRGLRSRWPMSPLMCPTTWK